MSDYKQEAHDQLRLMRFAVGDLEFAMGITEIREVIPPTEIRRIPKAPGFVEGVLSLRGAIIPVVDLRKLFGTTSESEDFNIILRQIKSVTVGYMVDQVRHVVTLAKSKILPRPPVVIQGLPKECIYGLFEQDEDTIILIDLSKTMGSKQVGEIEKMMQSVPSAK
ncbi:MAG: chemotaxis protein CheW [bacterium]|nr:chemotaxis protein CheW [bacterium]